MKQKLIAIGLILSLLLTSVSIKINAKNKAKPKWTSSNKKVVKVSKNAFLTAKMGGKATITAKIGKRKYKCKVTVKEDMDLSSTYGEGFEISDFHTENETIYIQGVAVEGKKTTGSYIITLKNIDYSYKLEKHPYYSVTVSLNFYVTYGEFRNPVKVGLTCALGQKKEVFKTVKPCKEGDSFTVTHTAKKVKAGSYLVGLLSFDNSYWRY